jgi:hypothetical protein
LTCFRLVPRTCTLLCLVLALTACQPEMIISLASTTETISAAKFKIRNAANSENPTYSSIKLYNANDNLLWHIRTEPLSHDYGIKEITYGVAPEHFVTVIEAQALAPIQEYALMAQGRGLGTLRFTSNAAGVLQKK